VRNTILFLGGAFLLASASHAQSRLGSAADEAAILTQRQAAVAAWNTHDPKAIAAHFADDVDRVRSNGAYSAGKPEVEKSFIDTLGGVDKNATLREESTHVRFLTPDVALVEMTVVITGATNGPVLREHGTLVYIKRNGTWVVSAIRSTRIQ
jgi:uncharacterized protein (TIGR02246 family)